MTQSQLRCWTSGAVGGRASPGKPSPKTCAPKRHFWPNCEETESLTPSTAFYTHCALGVQKLCELQRGTFVRDKVTAQMRATAGRWPGLHTEATAGGAGGSPWQAGNQQPQGPRAGGDDVKELGAGHRGPGQQHPGDPVDAAWPTGSYHGTSSQ